MTSIIHQTDLFHPHEDPDDHFDLATVFALAAMDRWSLQGVVVDYPPAREEGDPAAFALIQLARLTGIAGTPLVVGTPQSLRSRGDRQSDRPAIDRSAASWICETLKQSPDPVVINISGSCTDVALAGLMHPGLFEANCAGIYVNAGSAFPNKNGDLEYNVMLNPSSFAAIFDLPCPVYWCPCFHMTNTWEVGENGTWWSFIHEELFPELRAPVLNYFLFMLGRLPDWKYLRYLEEPVDEILLKRFNHEVRNMWCAAPLLHAAGMAVDMENGLVPVAAARNPLFDFQPVQLSCADDGTTEWEASADQRKRFLFRIRQPDTYSKIMTRTLGQLLGNL